MEEWDVIIIGGGPAGSACAGRLVQQGVRCLVLDQASFPRFKPCAGWLQPDIFSSLDIKPADYPLGLITFRSADVTFGRFGLRIPTLQYAIRRYEFDDWLLKRSRAPVQVHTVREIRREGGRYVVDGQCAAKYLVGAGGTHCPVYRQVFQPALPRPETRLVVAMEEEFEYPAPDSRLRLWFGEHGLPGYSWYVPKANGYVNVGIGGMAAGLKKRNETLRQHWDLLIKKLDEKGLLRGHTYKPSGHSYIVRHPAPTIQLENAFLVGDALGLATQDMGEGIGPAIQSGQRAAEAIVRGTQYTVAGIPRYSVQKLIRI